MARVEMATDSDINAFVGDGVRGFFTEHLGPDMAADAQRLVPVDTARLMRSLGFATTEETVPELHVGSFPDAEGDVAYVAATELGFHGPENVRAHTRNGHPVKAHVRQGNTPASPFLRPSLYQERYR